jgi:hypothetical protein
MRQRQNHRGAASRTTSLAPSARQRPPRLPRRWEARGRRGHRRRGRRHRGGCTPPRCDCRRRRSPPPQLVAKLVTETCGGARRVEDAMRLHLSVEVGSVRGRLLGIEGLFATISAASSSLGNCSRAASLNLTHVARTAPLFIAAPPARSRLLSAKGQREGSGGKKRLEDRDVDGKRTLGVGLALPRGAGPPVRILPRRGGHRSASLFIGLASAPIDF